MGDARKSVAAATALLALLLAVSFVVVLAATTAPDAMVTGFKGAQTRLRFCWRVAAFFMRSGTALNGTYAGLVTILTVGAGYVADLYKRTWQIVAATVLCIVGVGAATLTMIQVSQADSISTLRWFGMFETDAAAEAALHVFLGSLIGWFAVFLAAELGISLKAQGGALGKLLGRSSAED